jgi:hypothetical protein
MDENDEALMTNGKASLNAQMTMGPGGASVGHSDFVINSLFVIRHLSFFPS